MQKKNKIYAKFYLLITLWIQIKPSKKPNDIKHLQGTWYEEEKTEQNIATHKLCEWNNPIKYKMNN